MKERQTEIIERDRQWKKSRRGGWNGNGGLVKGGAEHH